jgi:hypothetical protein
LWELTDEIIVVENEEEKEREKEDFGRIVDAEDIVSFSCVQSLLCKFIV